ncbi:BQ5605_C028g10548 [Microbotryum silenes-dioicae]|uniref:BQ5605_C028g10548 protein n=1 Tax=Microbotryum silenes-dioicae TaxID=796604 RepID=A0A2X0PIX9_9BASI|nr:BQ5605_C028g10548 [Microbotryum silenes-dioicae]
MDSRPDMLVGPKTETDEFLQRVKPSANNTTGFPWYWVCIPRSKDDKEDALKPAEEQSFESRVDFMEQGQVLVDKLTKDCKHIAVSSAPRTTLGFPRGHLTDRPLGLILQETAPVRGNKKTGAKSQKELREIEHAKFNDQVAALAKKYNVLTGKWLLYPTADNVDAIWAKVVNAIAKPDGALAKTGIVHTAKVSTHAEEGQGYVICIYCDDSWDRDGVGKAFKCLVRELGLVSSAYKSDANTLLGIDSKHSSGIRSSLYGKTDFMTKDEIEQAIEKRKAELEAPVKVPKKLEKEEEEDGFVTDEDSDEEAPKAKKQKV